MKSSITSSTNVRTHSNNNENSTLAYTANKSIMRLKSNQSTNMIAPYIN